MYVFDVRQKVQELEVISWLKLLQIFLGSEVIRDLDNGINSFERLNNTMHSDVFL